MPDIILVVNALVSLLVLLGVPQQTPALLFLLNALTITTVAVYVFAPLPDSLGVLLKKLASIFLIAVILTTTAEDV